MGRVLLGVLTAAALLGTAPAGARAEEAPAGSQPMPLKGRVTLREKGTTYVIDGPQVIPKDAEIRLEADVRVLGINKASLEVQGSFEVHGTQDHWVAVRNVDFGPTLEPKGDVHFDMADVWGCAFVHPEGKEFRGHLTIENSCLQEGCRVDVRIAEGLFRFMTSESVVPVRVSVPPGTPKPPEIAFRTSWMRDLRLAGPCAGTIRSVEIQGVLDARDFTDLVVDGCYVHQSAAFHQGPEGSFSRLVLTKCNMLSGAKLILDRPTGPKTKVEKVKVDKFFFGTDSDRVATSDKEVAARIQDGADDPEVSVKAFWSKPNERKHHLLDDMLRMRAPQRGR